MKNDTTNKRLALVTGANQGVGLQVVKELVAAGHTVLLGSRDWAKGEAAVREVGEGAMALQIDVTDQDSIAAAAAFVQKNFGYLDLLVNNAAISNFHKGELSLQEYAKMTRASNIPLDEVRSIWETNVFGVLAVYQAMLPLLRGSAEPRIVNVSSGVGSLTTNADPAYPYRAMFSPGYAASKTALNGFEGTESIEDGSREVVRVALFGPEEPSGTFTRWENVNIPWQHNHTGLNSLSEVHAAFGLPKPLHPLISIVDGIHNAIQVKFSADSHITSFYKITYTAKVRGKVKYGQGYYDFDEGGLLFAVPNQLMGGSEHNGPSPGTDCPSKCAPIYYTNDSVGA